MTGRASSFPSISDRDADRGRDRRRLLDTLERLDSGQVPCRSGDVLPVVAWTSEDPDEAALAALACRTCPALTECRTYGLAWPTEHGTYGGLTPNQRTSPHRAARADERSS